MDLRYERLVFGYINVITTMAVPKRALLLTATAYAFFSARYDLGATPFAAKSYGKNTVTIFALLYLVRLAWNILVYPLFLTPLRKIPTPNVSLNQCGLKAT